VKEVDDVGMSVCVDVGMRLFGVWGCLSVVAPTPSALTSFSWVRGAHGRLRRESGAR
jgi:hypothetical protein